MKKKILVTAILERKREAREVVKEGSKIYPGKSSPMEVKGKELQ